MSVSSPHGGTPIFAFRDFNGRAAHCRLEWWRTMEHDVVIATELDDNPGASITNSAEHVMAEVVNFFKFRLDRLVWIEHYEPEQVRGKRVKYGEYESVTFKIKDGAVLDAAWHPMTKALWDELGIAIPADFKTE